MDSVMVCLLALAGPGWLVQSGGMFIFEARKNGPWIEEASAGKIILRR